MFALRQHPKCKKYTVGRWTTHLSLNRNFLPRGEEKMITTKRKWTKSEEDTLFAFGRNFFMRPTKKSAFKGARLDLKAANYLTFGRWEANPPPPPHRFFWKALRQHSLRRVFSSESDVVRQARQRWTISWMKIASETRRLKSKRR